MTEKVFNLVSRLKEAKRDTSGDLYIEGMASTNDPDRVGDIVFPKAWENGLNDFKKNPIILFNHNYDRPIGKATELEITPKGLRIKARISKAAKEIAELIEDGILGAFSVGFLVEDADYNEKTGGLDITKASLLETSVVSVPMNQDAIFNVAKSFDSEDEFREYVKQFKKVGLDEDTDELVITNNTVSTITTYASGTDSGITIGTSTTPTPAAVPAKEEKEKMDPKNEYDLDEIAAKAAEKAAAKLAFERAEKEAAEKLERERAEKDAKIAELEVGKTGAEKLVEDLQAEFAKKEADMAEALNKYQEELKAKADELEAMRTSKASFVDRTSSMNTKEWAKANSDDLVTAHMLGVLQGKRIDETDFGKQLFEKLGVNYVAEAPDLDQEIQDRILKEITVFTRVKDLFREVNVNGASTIMPFQSDVGPAQWAIDAAPDGNLENSPQVTANQYNAKQVTLNAYRLVSASFLHNDTDEQVLVNLMPMMVEGVARAHARAVEAVILNGNGTINGLDNFAPTGSVAAISAGGPGTLTAANLLTLRGDMGKFGLNPEDVAFIVNQTEYYSLLQDGTFANLNEVGDLATKIKGIVGAVYGSPVIVSDEFPAVAIGAPAAFAVNVRNYLVPRLRGVTVEQDYEVMNQRRVIVASQSLGFTEIQAGNGTTFEPVVKVDYTT